VVGAGVHLSACHAEALGEEGCCPLNSSFLSSSSSPVLPPGEKVPVARAGGVAACPPAAAGVRGWAATGRHAARHARLPVWQVVVAPPFRPRVREQAGAVAGRWRPLTGCREAPVQPSLPVNEL